MKRISILALAGLIAVPAWAGVVYEIEVTDHDSSPPATETTEAMVEGKNLKMTVASGPRGGQGEAIFRGDRREMIVVDHDDKSYVVIDQEAIDSIAGQLAGASKQIEEALKNVPPDQREMVERMMRERMPQQPSAPKGPSFDVRKSGERKTINGYPCVKYVVSSGDRTLRELWVTDWSNVEGGEELRDVFGDMAEFGRQLTEAFSGMPGAGAGFADGLFDQMEKIDGFPVVTRELDGGELESESTLRSSARRTLDPADFEPPAGYKRRSMMPQ